MNKGKVAKEILTVIGAAIAGAVGMEVYNQQKYSKRKAANKFFDWLGSNVNIKLSRGDNGIRIGNAAMRVRNKRYQPEDDTEFDD